LLFSHKESNHLKKHNLKYLKNGKELPDITKTINFTNHFFDKNENLSEKFSTPKSN
jgi:5-methylthioribose kinase